MAFGSCLLRTTALAASVYASSSFVVAAPFSSSFSEFDADAAAAAAADDDVLRRPKGGGGEASVLAEREAPAWLTEALSSVGAPSSSGGASSSSSFSSSPSSSSSSLPDLALVDLGPFSDPFSSPFFLPDDDDDGRDRRRRRRRRRRGLQSPDGDAEEPEESEEEPEESEEEPSEEEPFETEDGLLIERCEDTLSLFGDGDGSLAFRSAIDCSCAGDVSSSYAMTCVANDYCFEYDYGKACVDLEFKYYLEIDAETGRLPRRTGFVRRNTCAKFLRGDGPDPRYNGRLCVDSNPRCQFFAREELGLTSRMAHAVCTHQERCPDFFERLGERSPFNYTREQAESFCPTTTLGGKRCASGGGFPCGPSAPDSSGSFPPVDYGDDRFHIGTADCSNVDPCAGGICRVQEEYVRGGRPITNNPVYPQCDAGEPYPSSSSSSEGNNATTAAEATDGDVNMLLRPLDLYVRDYYLNYTTATESVGCSHDCGPNRGGSSDCVIQSRAFMVENHCDPRAKLSSSSSDDNDGDDNDDNDIARGSRAFFTAHGTMNCVRRYRDQHCQEPQGGFTIERNCKENDLLERCDERGTIWSMLPDHCVESAKPIGSYVVPLVSRRAYNSEGTCALGGGERGDDGVYVESLAPDDETLCQPGQYAQSDLNRPRLPGGVVTYCDTPTGKFKSDMYYDDECKVKDTPPPEEEGGGSMTMPMYTASASIGMCDPPPYPELGVPDFVRYGIEGCGNGGGGGGNAEGEGAPLYHCKNLAEAGLGTDVGAAKEEEGDERQQESSSSEEEEEEDVAAGGQSSPPPPPPQPEEEKGVDVPDLTGLDAEMNGDDNDANSAAGNAMASVSLSLTAMALTAMMFLLP